MQLEPGIAITGITLDRQIGSGGQGEVWSGRRADGREVAVKVLSGAAPQDVLRAMREARLQRAVEHPHIVGVLDFQLVDGIPVIVSELVDGVSLRQLLRGGRPTLDQIDRIAHQLFDAVEAAHQHGMVHRDLKPGNVLLTWKDGAYFAKLIDFGIAVESAPFARGDDLAGRGQAMGTAGFMAPEQTRSRELVDERADLFGLGAVLYWTATGRRAFTGGSWREVLVRSSEGRFLPVPAVAPEIDDNWARAIHWALEPSPERRPRTVDELRRAWDGVLAVPEWVIRGAPLVPELTESEGITEIGTPVPDQTDTSMAVSFGRHRDLARVREALAEAPVVTLRGPPGIGKTHLATRVAAAEAGAGKGWVQCYLTEATDRAGLLVALSAGLALAATGSDPETLLARAIAGRGPTVVVLDNAEQVRDALAPLLTRLVAEAPEARFVVTSRRKLGVPGERVVDLGPLDDASARALFQDRARRRLPNLRFAETEGETLAELIARLEGNPLALELAAARAVQTSSEALLADLDRGLQEPAMQVALRWSWKLLKPWERHVLGACAVFHGGLFAEAVDAMVDLSPWPMAPDLLDIVHGLVDHSLVAQRSLGQGESRLHPYAAVRTFVLDSLHPQEREAFEARHARWFAQFGAEAGVALRYGPAGIQATRTLIQDVENVVAALDWAIDHGEGAMAADCAWAIGDVLGRVGTPAAVVDQVRRALDMGGLSARDRARLYAVLGHLLKDAAQHGEAEHALNTALILAEMDGDAALEGLVLTRLGMLQHHTGQPHEAITRFQRALERLGPEGAPWYRALVRRQLCAAYQHLGDLDAADHAITEALELVEAHGIVTDLPLVHIYLGTLRAMQGQPDEGMVYEQLALQEARRMGDRVQEGRVLGNLGVRFFQLGQTDRSAQSFERAAAIARRTGSLGQEAIALGNLGEVRMSANRFDLAEAALERAVALGDRTWPVVAGSFRTTLARLRSRQERYDEAEALLDEAEPVLDGYHQHSHAGLVLARAEVAARRGDLEAARAALARADALFGRDELARDPDLCERLAEVVIRIEAASG